MDTEGGSCPCLPFVQEPLLGCGAQMISLYISRRYQSQRKAKNLLAWARAVKERDGYRCVRCGESREKLHAHHIVKQRDNAELVLDLSNGETLCPKCHVREHKGTNTRKTPKGQVPFDLRWIRETLRVNKVQASKLVGCSEPVWGKWEYGQNMPSAKYQKKLKRLERVARRAETHPVHCANCGYVLAKHSMGGKRCPSSQWQKYAKPAVVPQRKIDTLKRDAKKKGGDK